MPAPVLHATALVILSVPIVFPAVIGLVDPARSGAVVHSGMISAHRQECPCHQDDCADRSLPKICRGVLSFGVTDHPRLRRIIALPALALGLPRPVR
ncbi:hypothetical protein [Plastorhodobacter daqingensis]|uniref:hypothetical protein n=1 Tax=Plastorhodobacter daqingensis TaxID=1387281 RepID=UPI0036730167